MNMRELLDLMSEEFPVKIIDEPLTEEEFTYIALHANVENILLFNNIKGKNMPILTNILNSREKIKFLLGVKSDHELYSKILYACKNPSKNKVDRFESAPFSRNNIGKNLSKLPILKFFPKDPGPYITSGIVIAKGPKSGVYNASIHRLLVIGEDKMTIRIVPRHLWRLYREAAELGVPLKVSIVIGTHPLVLLAAASSPPFGVNELEVANTLLKGRLDLVKVPYSNILVPKFSEIVIEGEILHEEALEGPFVDATGTYDIKRLQPIVKVNAIWVSPNAIYYTIVPSSEEHLILMGLYKEAIIWDYVRKIAPVKKVRLTRGGCRWLHVAISIKKLSEGDAKNVIMAAFSAHPSLKHVIVVDEDIDIDNPYEIEWAIATRFQATKDLVIIPRARGSSLDPSADQENMLTDKVGIDATKPIKAKEKSFNRVKLKPSPKCVEILKNLERLSV
ncbi:MAG TPA: UbiD family decarboxylase [Thermoprotei archaeon]|nr:UbiD family decarboxylase [Thermoprotei archaeon]